MTVWKNNELLTFTDYEKGEKKKRKEKPLWGPSNKPNSTDKRSALRRELCSLQCQFIRGEVARSWIVAHGLHVLASETEHPLMLRFGMLSLPAVVSFCRPTPRPAWPMGHPYPAFLSSLRPDPPMVHTPPGPRYLARAAWTIARVSNWSKLAWTGANSRCSHSWLLTGPRGSELLKGSLNSLGRLEAQAHIPVSFPISGILQVALETSLARVPLHFPL